MHIIKNIKVIFIPYHFQKFSFTKTAYVLHSFIIQFYLSHSFDYVIYFIFVVAIAMTKLSKNNAETIHIIFNNKEIP